MVKIMKIAGLALVFTLSACGPTVEGIAVEEGNVGEESATDVGNVKEAVGGIATVVAAVLKSTDTICEDFGTHTYCVSAELPAPPATPTTWGSVIGYSPEVFCASDLSGEICSWVMAGLLAAIIEWGNYGPVEYWVLGIDVAASEKLTAVNCQRRVDREQDSMEHCMERHSPSGEYGFESYRKVGADAVAAGRPRQDAGRNGVREWGIHFFISSVPFAFTDYFDLPGADGQKTVFHEYFHAVQLAHISPEDRGKRDELKGPIWFHEGGAEYMAQYGSREAHLSGILQKVNVEGRWPFVFEEKMKQKMEHGLEKMRSACPGISMKDITYENRCDGAGYDIGAWAHAYLASKFGHDVLLDTYYANLDALGWEDAFIKTYGMATDEFYGEFDAFLELPLSEQIAILPAQPATDVPTQSATDSQKQGDTVKEDASPAPTAIPAVLMGTDTICENLANHTYCLSAELPAPPAIPTTWGAVIGYSPEVFCASDLSTELCGWVTSALITAILEWGNYGPVEYWVLGIDVTAAETLTEVNCQRRVDRGQWNMNDCMDKHSPSGEHGFDSYRKLGADAVASGRPGGSAGLNGARDWGIHFFSSSLPVGFTDYFEVSGAEEQKTIFHEYFHAVQHASIYTEDHLERDDLLGPVWFNEGGAEYMAQYGSRKARASGALQQVNAEGRWPFVFEEQMEQKMRHVLEKRRSVCPGVSMKDITYENNCHNIHYDEGAWAHAYLASKFGHDVLLDVFYANIEELGWEETFLRTYGMTSEAFYAEFETFLELPLSEQLEILLMEEETGGSSGQVDVAMTPMLGEDEPDDGVWSISVDIADFSLAGGVPNLAWLSGEQKLVLTYTESGWKMQESSGDLDFRPVDDFTAWLNQLTAGTGFVLAEPIVREDASGKRRYFAKRMYNQGDVKRPLYGFVENENKTGFQFLNGGNPVYEGQNDAYDSPTYYIEVADITETTDGGWRMFYVAKDAYLYSSDPTPQNVRTAYSSDDGLSWDFEFDSPFGETGKTADKRNADPAPLRLSDGSYMAVTMRQHLLYFWSSEDGLNFVESDEVLGPQEFSSVVPNGTGLYDPALALLDDGMIWMVVTVGTSDGRNILAAASISINPLSP